jgi:alkylated DNA nucleotide flippase Atl1
MQEEFVEAVLDAVEKIPPGQVASYGDVAEFVGRGGPRQVGSVMAHYGGAVSWWRVVRADGRPASGLEARAIPRLIDDGTPVRNGRVIMSEARWVPPVDGAGRQG